MSETVGGGAEAPAIEMPSALRIRQRLGMIATSRLFSDELIPSIAELEGQTFTPAELVSNLETRTADYAERHQLEMVRHVQQNSIPRIIEKLVDDPGQKDAALDMWEALKAKRIAEDEASEQARYLRRGTSRHQTRRAKRRGRY